MKVSLIQLLAKNNRYIFDIFAELNEYYKSMPKGTIAILMQLGRYKQTPLLNFDFYA